MKELTEIRCPEHAFRLFAKVIKVDKKSNCFEIRCRECSKKHSKKMGQKVDVFHYFNLEGFLESRIKPIGKESEKNGR